MARKIPLICGGHSRPVPDFNYSKLLDDGFFLVSACLDGKPMLRRGETGDWIGTFAGHKGAVWSASLNSTALQAATGSADYSARLWNALTGEEIKSFAHERIVKSVNFSPDDTKLLTGGQDKILRVFDLGQPDAKPLTLEGHTQSVKIALWCADGNTIISGGGDAAIRVWDARTLTQVKTIATKAEVKSIELCLDGKHMFTTSGREAVLWDAKTFDMVKTYPMPYDLNSASMSPDGSSFVTGGQSDFWARVYDAQGKEMEVLKGHHGPIHCIRFAPDGATFASGSEDGTIRLWQSGEPKSYGLWQVVNSNEPPK